MTEIGRGAGPLNRFYKEVSLGESDAGYGVLLDGRAAKTPARAPLAARSRALAERVAAEWAAAGPTLDARALPLTKLLATTIDQGAARCSAWGEDAARYLETDLLCYRAEGPAALAARQSAIWDPFIDWFETVAGVRLACARGVIAVAQPDGASQALRSRLAAASPGRVLAVKTLAEITGSGVLGLAAGEGARSADDVFAAARLDETFQREQWGDDEEAVAREAALRRDFDVTVFFAAEIVRP